ncbi:MAG TPA: AAA family ATPase [Actinomycetota bacterium]|nr:AAA family ATPase [Actinomycetota bacterium]
MQVCPSCGEENPDRFRLCGMCGAELASAPPPGEVRKTVTVVFSDLAGSTALGERLDSESLREVLGTYFAEMRAVLERHGGTVEKYIGDAIMAVFGLPTLHEDDALRAVRAAAEMQEALARLNERLALTHGVGLENRTGVNTGEVVAGDARTGQRLVTGDAVNVAARLEQAAPALGVLLGEPTYRLVRGAVEVEPVEPLALRGKSRPMPAYLLRAVRPTEGVVRRLDAPLVGRGRELAELAEAFRAVREERTCRTVTVVGPAGVGKSRPMPAYLLRAVRPTEGVVRRLDAPLVGRGRELAELAQAFQAVRGERTCRTVTVVGPAGVGKSRLLLEFLDRIEGQAVVLRGRCLSYGEGITFWPLAEVLRAAGGIEDDDPPEAARAKLAALVGPEADDVAQRLAAAIGLSDAAFPVEETLWAARRLLEGFARGGPTVLVIDDIHWAEATFLDLLTYLGETITDLPVLVLCSARPELFEEHFSWGEGPGARTLHLEPLTEAESAAVAEHLLGGDGLDERLLRRVTEAAEGNPLFVEQMISMLVDDGLLVRDRARRWRLTRDVGGLEIPPSIGALLSARLDRLAASERTVIERGAVVGQVFFRGAVEELAPEEIREQVPADLGSLVRKQLIGPHASTFAGQEAYRFAHILIRDAAYHGLLKRTRAELHERFVDWLERVAPERAMEYEEIRGYHLEQAFLIRAQLGPLDERAVELGRRAASHLEASGRRALARGDMPAAGTLLQRAAALLPADGEARVRLQLLAAEALVEVGELTAAEALLGAAAAGASSLGDPGLEAAAAVARLLLAYTTHPEASGAEAVEEVRRLLPVPERLGDHATLARAWRLLTLIHFYEARYEQAERAARRMIEHARRAGDEVMARRVLPTLSQCAVYGPTPVPAAIERCEGILAEVGGDRKAAAVTLAGLARLEAMRGNVDRARAHYRRSRAILQEMGWRLHAALTSIDSGFVELLAGDPVAAERELRGDHDALEEMGERNYISTTRALLAEALYQQGRLDEAERCTRMSEEVAAPDDVSSQFLWRCVWGKVLARRGRFVEAERLVREGLAIVGTSDEPDSQAGALMDLAEVLVLAGRPGEAVEAATEARSLFERKGNVVSAARARRAIAGASTPAVGIGASRVRQPVGGDPASGPSGAGMAGHREREVRPVQHE